MSQRVTPELVLNAYCQGIFPMGERGGGISWHSPDPRCVFPLDRFHIPQTLKKTIRRGVFQIRVNVAFREVMTRCGNLRAEGTWISPQIIRLYTALHEAGFAHSVESWQDGRLVGGLYGVTIGAAYFGESMFHSVTDASKVALVALVERLASRGYRLLDTQWKTAHLARFGAIEIPREEYLSQLAAAIVVQRSFTDESPLTGVNPEPR